MTMAAEHPPERSGSPARAQDVQAADAAFSAMLDGFDAPPVPPPLTDAELAEIEARAAAVLGAELTRLRAAVARAAIDVEHLSRQRTWSSETFGPGPRTLGVIDHIRKELAEIEADPTDLGEWVDVIILAFDGAWRAGWEPAQIIAAVKAKQAVNEGRTWPDWRTRSESVAIEHDREALAAEDARSVETPDGPR